MSFQKFLETINIPIFLKSDERRKYHILNTNPDRIYLENVRSYFNTSTFMAKTLCEMAVKDGHFIKKVGIECPNEDCQKIIKTYLKSETIDEQITCQTCNMLGKEASSFNTNELKHVEFYQLA